MSDGVFLIFLRGASIAFIMRALGVGLVFLLQLLLARLLGAEVFGQYIYVFTWITVLALIGKLGLDTGSLRYLSTYQSLSQWGLVRGYIRWSSELATMASLLLLFFTALIIWLLSERLGSDLTKTFLVGLLVLPFMVLMQLYSSYMQAFKYIGRAQLPQSVLRPIFIGATIFCVYSFGFVSNAALVMGIELVSTIVAFGVAWVFVRRISYNRFIAARINYRKGEWLKSIFPMFIVSGAQMVLAKSDIIMVGMLLSPTQAGKYAVASLLAGLVTFFIMAANQIVAPLISELYHQEKFLELQRIITISVVSIFAITLPLILILAYFGVEFLGLFGMEFRDQYSVLFVLMVGQIVIVAWGPVGFLLTMTHHQSEASWIIGAAAILNLVLNIILIPALGVIGAAIATSIAVSLRSIALGFVVWRKLKIMPTLFSPILLRFWPQFPK
ncbi:MAG: oligosaccharide flippase family protein [Gammaproteobacteria bacterium]|nr:oligosaccharide flippase family protein [Gammaproteobacteria bacterium]